MAIALITAMAGCGSSGTDATATTSPRATSRRAATTQRYTACENAYLNGHDDADLKRLATPTLVMNGTDDQLVPPGNAKVIAVPNSPHGGVWCVATRRVAVVAGGLGRGIGDRPDRRL